MVAEGGNLGFTQLGRVEYALADGLIYTDAIDNSAGVDCSDHEVNIKILLGDVVAAGGLPAGERNELLFEMTDEVADLVLDNNRAQTLGLMIARRQALPMANVHARYVASARGRSLARPCARVPADRPPDRRPPVGRPRTAHTRAGSDDGVHEERRRRRHPADRPARRPGAGGRPVELLPRAVARTLPGCDPDPSAASRDHHDPARQPDGQPVGHLVRPPDDRGHRRVDERRRSRLGRDAGHLRVRGAVA